MATRSRRSKDDAPGLVTWGWYAIVSVPETTLDLPAKGTPRQAGTNLVHRRLPGERYFWAAWWTEEPRLDPRVEPDAIGFVAGHKGFLSAISEADRAIRLGKNWRVYTRNVAEAFALGAYNEGAPTTRATSTNFDALARAGFEALGLPLTASDREVRKRYRTKVAAEKLHPDQGGDRQAFEQLTELYNHALRVARAREKLEKGAQFSVENPPPPKKRRKKSTPDGQAEVPV